MKYKRKRALVFLSVFAIAITSFAGAFQFNLIANASTDGIAYYGEQLSTETPSALGGSEYAGYSWTDAETDYFGEAGEQTFVVGNGNDYKNLTVTVQRRGLSPVLKYGNSPSTIPIEWAGNLNKHTLSDFTGTTTFNANGGVFESSATIYTETTVIGSAVILPPELTREGYEFDGWWTTADNSGEEVTSVIQGGTSKTYYAHWEKIGTVSVTNSLPSKMGDVSIMTAKNLAQKLAANSTFYGNTEDLEYINEYNQDAYGYEEDDLHNYYDPTGHAYYPEDNTNFNSTFYVYAINNKNVSSYAPSEADKTRLNNITAEQYNKLNESENFENGFTVEGLDSPYELIGGPLNSVTRQKLTGGLIHLFNWFYKDTSKELRITGPLAIENGWGDSTTNPSSTQLSKNCYVAVVRARKEKIHISSGEDFLGMESGEFLHIKLKDLYSVWNEANNNDKATKNVLGKWFILASGEKALYEDSSGTKKVDQEQAGKIPLKNTPVYVSDFNHFPYYTRSYWDSGIEENWGVFGGYLSNVYKSEDDTYWYYFYVENNLNNRSSTKSSADSYGWYVRVSGETIVTIACV